MKEKQADRMEEKMAGQVKKPVKITETVLRDAHQSLIATRCCQLSAKWIKLDIIR